jgi:hypothetical protein
VTSRDPAPLRRRRGRRYVGRRSVRAFAAVLLLVIGLAACSTPAETVSPGAAGSSSPAGTGTAAPERPASAVPSRETPGAAPSASATAAPSGVSSAVDAALKTLLAASPQPSREQIRASLSTAGFAPAAVEVSASRTPTGLAADAVEIGVLGDTECVMAQIRSGTVATSVLPVLPNGRCFIGSVQR